MKIVNSPFKAGSDKAMMAALISVFDQTMTTEKNHVGSLLVTAGTMATTRHMEAATALHVSEIVLL